jgi:hypothetical protein
MRKLLLLTLSCVIWLGSWPRPASAACGDKVSNEIMARPSYTALLQGKLEELPLMRCPRPAPWMLYTDGQQIYVDFGANAELLAKAKKLHNSLVEIGGTLEDTGKTEWINGPRVPPDPMPNRVPSRVRILHVTSLSALADPGRTPVDLTGELVLAGELQRWPPIPIWALKANDKTYSLRFNSAALAERAKNIGQGTVTVIGTLNHHHTITVTGLVHTETPRILLPSIPEEISPHIFKPVIAK